MRLPITPGSYELGSTELAARKMSHTTRRARLQADRCDLCLQCWIFCPDSAISVGRRAVEIRAELCKGCGICATECPEGAISMFGGI